MKRLTAVLLFGFLFTLLLACPAFADIVAIDDGFESGSLSGWTTTGASVGIVDGVAGANGKVVKVKGTGESNLIKDFDALNNKVIAEMRVMTDATNKEKRIFLQDMNGSSLYSYAYLRFNVGGSLTAVLSSSEVQVLSSVTPGQWYSLKVEMSVSSGKYNVYVDGVLKASTVARNSAHATEINRLDIKPRDGGALYVDDVKLYEVAPPQVLQTVPTYDAASYYVPYTNSGAQVDVWYRKSGESEWESAFAPFYSATDRQFRGSIVDLDENTAYEMKADISDNGALVQSLTSSFTTWASDVPIARTIPVSELTAGGPLLIDGMQGSESGWIKIVGDGTTIDGGSDTDSAVTVQNSKYLILDKLNVRGGQQNGVTIKRSDSIRFAGSEVSGWGRVGTFLPDKGYAVDANGAIVDFDSGIKVTDSSNITVERNYVHDPRGQTNSWYGPTWSNVHPHGMEGMTVNAGTGTGGIVIRYNDIIGSDDHRWNDGISGAAYNGYSTAGPSRDGDIYGNMIAFGNDDGTELDGGQMNVRYHHNKIEGFYSAVSTAPDMMGPSYIFRNLVVNLADAFNQVGSFIKAGGGTTYAKGKEYAFQNTIFSRGQGINGIGYGSDADRKMFHGMSRNNVIVGTRVARDYAIKDSVMAPGNDFDYDVLGNRAKLNGMARVQYADGQEAHGALGLPTFRSMANADFRLAAGSLGVDAGLPLPNFSETYAGSAPDDGAFEQGASSLMPARPIPLTADKYQVNLKGADSQAVTVTVGDLKDGSIPYRIRKNDANDWLTVTPESGVLTANSALTFTVQADPSKFRSEVERAVVLVRLDNGYSLPVTVYADNTPPVTDLEIQATRVNPASDPVAVYNTDVSMTMFANNEAVSYIEYEYSLDGGAHWTPYNGQFTFTEDGAYMLSYRAIDASGNVEEPNAFRFVIDRTPPAIDASQAPAPNSNGWNNSDVTVGFVCADAESGIASCPAPVVLTAEGAGQSASGTAADQAGNTASAAVYDINIDKTMPLLSIQGAGMYSVTQNVYVTCTASDELSGLDGSPCGESLAAGPAYQYGPGEHTVTVKATDKAGNAASAQAVFTVTASPEELAELTRRFLAETGKPGYNGIGNSLVAKLEHSDYSAYRNEVSAQSGKALTKQQADTLTAFAARLLP